MILWSGGVDSTLILADALKAEKRARERGSWLWPTRTLSINWQTVPQNDEQLAARKRLKKILSSEYGEWPHLEATMTFAGDIDRCRTFGGLGQPQIWVSVAATVIGQSEPFVVGYHDGDQAWRSIAEIRDAFRILGGISGRSNPFETPLADERKAQIIERLQAHGSALYDAVWWCENPKRTTRPKKSARCGDCTPCRTHKLAIVELSLFPKAAS